MEVGKEDLKNLRARSNLSNERHEVEDMRKVQGSECVDDNKMSLTLEAVSGKKRKPNWTDQECCVLAQLMEERKDIIRGKCSTGVSTQDKRKAWEEITKAINAASPQVQRTASDCNKKWENLLAKSRNEIKMLKRKNNSDGLSLKKLSPLCQTVISVMNLSDSLLQNREDLSTLLMSQSSCDEDGNNSVTGETFTDGHTVTERVLPAGPSNSSAEQLTVFVNIPQSVTGPLSSPRAGLSPACVAELGAPCVTSPPSEHCTALQERKDLEMSVLRRQEAVLKLQEEYYTLKIKMMKKQMEESNTHD
ncbi:uncharacterized protein LOC117507230 [Thalassophryne amazonica]|uniref:uncharacterized protein LOC117507230 n=1 Tax=Thalassophryne amazonica TaxID=390379 RepID=UPI001471A012|nr:uncharacterized protein LOC117507230 [Thalassophryne amazonica]XP_034022945.1 uncharacterized protein LOC117507230 [Thalassophryne amazonica]